MYDPPPPPPPPPLPSVQPLKSNDEEVLTDPLPFVVHCDDDNHKNAQFTFPKTNLASGSIPLRVVISQYLGASHSSTASAHQLFQMLGRFRCLAYALQKYNCGLQEDTPEFLKYWRRHTVDLLSCFGFNLDRQSGIVHIPGLDGLISRIEDIYSPEIYEYKALISKGMTSFAGLLEIFKPDVPVKASLLPHDTSCVFRVTDAFFQERRNAFGSRSQDLHVTLEAVVAVGDHFSVASFTEVISSWTGNQHRSLSDMLYRPVASTDEDALRKRAGKVCRYGKGRGKYVAYDPNSFIIHPIRGRTGSTISQSKQGSVSLSGGRIMVDMARGTSLDYYPCNGADEGILAIKRLSSRYRQWSTKRDRSDPPDEESIYLWDDVPNEFLIYCWPALVGFSFTAKAWGFVLADGLSDIMFQEQAFDKLVLSQERKELVRAVVRCGTSKEIQGHDFISTKQGGLIFLLHGPPGVGKTLTAEAVAESLQCPLYYITMGELGTTPEVLESRLGDILDLCSEWNALVILDEADVFLETRRTSDLVRNAMVCVMLRILEYHTGILFFTTNRVRSLDPAFESRITISISYESLDRASREHIWKNQLECYSRVDFQNLNYQDLAEQQLNGRQIKNIVRLALSLAIDQDAIVTQETLLQVTAITTLGHQNVRKDSTWENSTKLA